LLGYFNCFLLWYDGTGYVVLLPWKLRSYSLGQRQTYQRQSVRIRMATRRRLLKIIINNQLVSVKLRQHVLEVRFSKHSVYSTRDLICNVSYWRWCQSTPWHQFCLSKVRNQLVNHSLDGYECKNFFFPFSDFPLRFNEFDLFTHIATSSTETNDVTNWVTHIIFNANLCAVNPYFTLKFPRINSTSSAVFNQFYWFLA